MNNIQRTLITLAALFVVPPVPIICETTSLVRLV